MGYLLQDEMGYLFQDYLSTLKNASGCRIAGLGASVNAGTSARFIAELHLTVREE